MGSKQFDGVLFTTKMGDHDPRHFHAFVGGGEVIIDLTSDRRAILSDRNDAVRGATTSDVKKTLRLAAQHFDALANLWEEAHGKN